MNQYENEQVSRPQTPVRRRRKPRKPPYKALLICAAIIFAVGFLSGFLIRGLFLPKKAETTETQPGTTTESTTEPSSEAPTAPLAGRNAEDWLLTLVNPWNSIDDNFQVEVAEVPNGYYVDKRCYDDLMAMWNAMQEAGLNPVIRSGYRTMGDQRWLLDRKVDELISAGYTRADAEAEAATIVAVPGTSEHQLGLAVDIVDESYRELDERQESTDVQKWLMENCWDYGFILRYPNDKSEITGIIYEPWHYRYVGREIAKDIQARGICFEEYLQLLNS